MSAAEEIHVDEDWGHAGWTADKLPDLAGQTYVVTGGNSGIGYEAARTLGARGGAVTIICRNEQKAHEAVQKLADKAPAGKYGYQLADLADLASVKAAADAILKAGAPIHALVNNAGIMMLPKRTLTKDGFETQFGVNHLGHFALNAALAERVEESAGRFVSVASIAHKFAPGFRFDDLMFEKSYNPTRAYAQSKLANLVYAMELNRRLEAAGLKSRAYACHPGYSDTNLQSTGPGSFSSVLLKPLTAIFSQTAHKGALPTVLCAAGLEAAPGGYYGPTGFYEMTGPVGAAKSTSAARSKKNGARLWDASLKLTRARWSIFGD